MLHALLLLVPSALAGNAITSATLSFDRSTPVGAGYVVTLVGDDDWDASGTVRFRVSGTATWRDGLAAFRVENRDIGGVHPGNILAGSLFDLAPDTTYEIEVTVTDADGGGSVLDGELSTRAMPAPTDLSSPLYVEVGSGGGSGTAGDPYGGIDEALLHAGPGDVLLLLDGTYPDTYLDVSGTAAAPLTIRGASQDGVVFEPSSDVWAIDVDGASHLVLENFSVANTRRGISVDDATDVVIRNVSVSIERTASGDPVGLWVTGSTDVTACDNTFVGPEVWTSRVDDSYAIKVGGSGHLVCHNQVTRFWDSFGMSDTLSTSLDIVRNDFRESTDDGIETDYSQRNIRVLDNRIANSLKGVSAQPAYGGPVYFIRNEMFNLLSSAYKFHVNPSGLVVLQNSSASAERAFSNGEWSNAVFRNNILYGATGYMMETTGTLEDFDYDAWAPQQTPALKFNGVRYDTLNDHCGDTTAVDDFCAMTGNEAHGVTFAREDMWTLLPEPLGSSWTASPGDWSFALDPAAVAVDAGVVLGNVNDCWVGAGPDMGAYELGGTAVAFGPRADWEGDSWDVRCDPTGGEGPGDPGDSGTTDSGTTDSGTTDSGTTDSGTTDSGTGEEAGSGSGSGEGSGSGTVEGPSKGRGHGSDKPKNDHGKGKAVTGSPRDLFGILGCACSTTGAHPSDALLWTGALLALTVARRRRR